MPDYYGNLDNPGEHYYEKPRNSKRKWIIVGSIVGLLAIIAIGVGVGVAVSHKGKDNRSASASKSSQSNNSNNSSPVTQTDPNDPSTFVKDSRLKQSFYGLAYTPNGSQLPSCGNSLQDVIEDVQLMSQLTTRIRLYGADCNQSALVLEAIKQTKVNISVFLGNYPVPTDNTAYTRQRDTIIAAIQTYGTDNIAGVTVGNEFMLNYLNANGAQDPNSAVGNTGAQLLIADIQDTVSAIQALNLNKHIPVGTADAGAYFNTEVLSAVEYGMSNVHPWFANVSIDQAAAWTNEFFQEQNVQPASLLSNHPTMYIAETGWPSNSSDAGNESNGPSTASNANLQEFLNTFVCQSNTNGTGYFYFEFFDEPWKDQQFGGVEGWWGLFTSNKTLKPIEIPDCPSP
ncbi:glycoside hydrolase family 17 protein [Auriscalpium vulgare]|uniref:Glycoside hydrolase family 17 protein n=1 Tax=Auriscalpium vulgare TaxID=40419 RepID=A0ACB8RIU2_9AGAM|nr:glycoside hydrolase family 17 protein [Auriscalpium vulgare]